MAARVQRVAVDGRPPRLDRAPERVGRVPLPAVQPGPDAGPGQAGVGRRVARIGSGRFREQAPGGEVGDARVAPAQRPPEQHERAGVLDRAVGEDGRAAVEHREPGREPDAERRPDLGPEGAGGAVETLGPQNAAAAVAELEQEPQAVAGAPQRAGEQVAAPRQGGGRRDSGGAGRDRRRGRP